MTLTTFLTLALILAPGILFWALCKGGWALPDHPVETPAETITTTTEGGNG